MKLHPTEGQWTMIPLPDGAYAINQIDSNTHIAILNCGAELENLANAIIISNASLILDRLEWAVNMLKTLGYNNNYSSYTYKTLENCEKLIAQTRGHDYLMGMDV